MISDNLFYLEKLGVQIDIPSITKDVVIINTIEINQPEITYEMLSFKQNNVSDVLKNLKSSIASSEKEKLTENKKTVKKAEKTASKKVIINNFIVLEHKQSGIFLNKYAYSKNELFSGEQYLGLYGFDFYHRNLMHRQRHNSFFYQD